MNDTYISDAVRYIGVNDSTLDLFESQYQVPDGVTYNSYVILDEKVAVMDTVDGRATETWLSNLEQVLGDAVPDYLVVSHMEPDHAFNIRRFAERYPQAKIVGNAKTFGMISQFFDLDVSGRNVVVKEGDVLELGNHTLQFFMAPMVHWPEVMVTYEQKEKLLFSADGFGTFGTLDAQKEDWAEEAGRYYLNIVGKYGMQVQSLLKKASALDIEMICPLHGPVLKGNLDVYFEKYQTWSSYEPEEKGILVAYASIHGNTADGARRMAELLREQGEKTEVLDLARTDLSVAVRKAFYYDRMILACATYDGGLFPCMEEFLHHLKAKNFQKRKVGLMENGSWAPMAAKQMRAILETMKQVEIPEEIVTIRSAVHEDTVEQMKILAKAMGDCQEILSDKRS